MLFGSTQRVFLRQHQDELPDRLLRLRGEPRSGWAAFARTRAALEAAALIARGGDDAGGEDDAPSVVRQ